MLMHLRNGHNTEMEQYARYDAKTSVKKGAE